MLKHWIPIVKFFREFKGFLKRCRQSYVIGTCLCHPLTLTGGGKGGRLITVTVVCHYYHLFLIPFPMVAQR